VIAFGKTQVYSTKPTPIHGFINLSFGGVLLDHVQPMNVMYGGDRPRAEFLLATFDFNSGGGLCVNMPGLFFAGRIHDGTSTFGRAGKVAPRSTGLPVAAPLSRFWRSDLLRASSGENDRRNSAIFLL
jgi:hypothetical protein